MAEVLLFHHIQGLTPGVVAFADALRAKGHTVHTPDLYDGETFEKMDEGAAYMQSLGGGAAVRERGLAVARELPAELVYAGLSLGVMAAQQLAQTREGAVGALLIESAVPPSTFGGEWPVGVPVQIHGMDDDEFFAHEGDIDAARALVAEAADGELFVYPGDKHLFADSSLPSYDAGATALLIERALAFLGRVDAR